LASAVSLSVRGDALAASHYLLVVPALRRPGRWLIMADWLAITIGPLIVAWRPLAPQELAHELVHVRQWRRHGLRFIPRYFLASRRAARAGGDRYRDNEFELEAARADQVRSR
jgi:hypothetical protein